MRFHFGISFRWSTIKKFLFPFLVGFLAYFGFSSIFDHFNLGFLQVFANSNYNTQYDINVPDFDNYFNDYTCGSENVKDFLHNFIDNYNYSPHLLIIPFVDFSNGYYEGNTIMFLAYSRNNTQYNRFSFYSVQNGTVKTGYLFNANNSYSTSKQYILNLDTCDSNISTSNSWLAFKNFLSTVSSSIDVSDNVGTYKSSGSANTTFTRSGNGLSFDNSNSFTINSLEGNDFYKSFAWPYWSDRSLQYKATLDSVYSSSTAYFKKLHIVINDTTYNYLDYDIPTFYDLKELYPEPGGGGTESSFLGFKSSIDTIYTNLLTSNISNYNLQYNFQVPLNVLSQDYVDNVSFDTTCYTRLSTDPDNISKTFYTYQKVDCSLSSTYSINNDKVSYTFTNLTFTNNNLLGDKVYITIRSNYLDDTISSTIYNVKYTFNGNFYNTPYRGPIYETFENLPLNFSMMVSGYGSTLTSNFSIYKPDDTYKINYFAFSPSTQEQKDITILGESILSCINSNTCDIPSEQAYTNNSFITFSVSSNYNDTVVRLVQTGTVQLPKLHLFLYPTIGISFGDIRESEFYFIDNTGTTTHNTFIEPIPVNNDTLTNNYNLSFYLGQVNTFINNLSASTFIIQQYTQDFYNGLPLLFQTFLLTMFILACVYIIYKEVKR